MSSITRLTYMGPEDFALLRAFLFRRAIRLMVGIIYCRGLFLQNSFSKSSEKDATTPVRF